MPGLHTTVGLIEHGHSGLLLLSRLLFTLLIVQIIGVISADLAEVLPTSQWLRCSNFVRRRAFLVVVVFFRLDSQPIFSQVVTIQLTDSEGRRLIYVDQIAYILVWQFYQVFPFTSFSSLENMMTQSFVGGDQFRSGSS